MPPAAPPRPILSQTLIGELFTTQQLLKMESREKRKQCQCRRSIKQIQITSAFYLFQQKGTIQIEFLVYAYSKLHTMFTAKVLRSKIISYSNINPISLSFSQQPSLSKERSDFRRRLS